MGQRTACTTSKATSGNKSTTSDLLFIWFLLPFVPFFPALQFFFSLGFFLCFPSSPFRCSSSSRRAPYLRVRLLANRIWVVGRIKWNASLLLLIIYDVVLLLCGGNGRKKKMKVKNKRQGDPALVSVLVLNLYKTKPPFCGSWTQTTSHPRPCCLPGMHAHITLHCTRLGHLPRSHATDTRPPLGSYAYAQTSNDIQ